MRFEDAYEDDLRSLESAIVGVYRDQPDLLDKEVDVALNALLNEYNAELLGRHRKSLQPAGRPGQVSAKLRAMCEWRLGRGELPEDIAWHAIEDEEPIDVRETVRCLKRIKKSVKFWSKKEGRQGYLRYIDEWL